MKTLFRLGEKLHSVLHSPAQVAWGCLFFVSTSLLLNGSLLRLYGLHRDETRLREQTEKIYRDTADLNKRVKQASDPAFIQRQAVDRYDFADKNDLVFVFSDE